MRNELRIAALIRVISVVALIIGASGCATQGSGGSKLDHSMLRSQFNANPKRIKVCTQGGAVMNCRYEDEDELRAQLDWQLELLRNDFD